MSDLRTLARLNTDTRPHHADADDDVERFLFGAHVTRANYIAFLERLYGFLVPVEAALAAAPGLGELVDLEVRNKSPSIERDLLALGVSVPEIAALPQCQSIPAFRGPAAALGWMYVVERPMLACGVIRSHLETALRAEMAHASSYLTCYAGQVGMLWRELGVVMDEVSYTSAVGSRIVVAAHDAFRCLTRWRTHELSRVSAIRYVG